MKEPHGMETKQVPSIAEVAKKRARAIAAAFAVLTLTAALGLALGFSASHQRQLIAAAIEPSIQTLDVAYSTGDTFQLVRLLDALVASRAAQDARLEDSSGRVVARSQHNSTGEHHAQLWKWQRKSPLLRAPATLVVEGGVPVAPFASAAAMATVLALVGYALAHLGLTAFARWISKPLVELAKRIETTKSASDGLTTAAAGTLPYTELRSIDAAMRGLYARLTKLEAVEREAAKVQAVVSTVQMVAHDIRRPFSALSATLSVLRTLPDVGPGAKAKIEYLGGEVKRAKAEAQAMLDDFLDLGAARPFKAADVSILTLIETSLGEVFRNRTKDDVALAYELRGGMRVRGDAARLARVLTNLVENAAQAMKGKGRITFACEDDGVMTTLRLHNTNSVIAAEHLPRLFEPFFTHGKSRGTGLGLAIVKKVIEAHGGSIEVASSAADGTTFSIRLPTSPGATRLGAPILPLHVRDCVPGLHERSEELLAAAREELAAAVGDLGRPLVVVHMDDEVTYLDLVRSIVEADPIAARCLTWRSCVGIDQGLAACAGPSKPDVVLCDLHFEGDERDGQSALREVAELAPHAGRALHTCGPVPELDLGVPVVGKPLRLADLYPLAIEAAKKAAERSQTPVDIEQALAALTSAATRLEEAVRAGQSPLAVAQEVDKTAQKLELLYFDNVERGPAGGAEAARPHQMANAIASCRMIAAMLVNGPVESGVRGVTSGYLVQYMHTIAEEARRCMARQRRSQVVELRADARRI